MSSRSTTLLSLAFAACTTAVLGAQVVNPAEGQHREGQEPPTQQKPIIVEARQVSPLREEDRVGPYDQPQWTTRRLFAETRIYVRPEGSVEFEYWVIPKVPRHGPTQTETRYELEFGLPYRFQLDLYAVSHQTGNQGPLSFDQQQVELRWAFADWGKIPANPTAYVEWKAINDEPDVVEAKLLLGDEITTGWHWGVNLVYEHVTGAARDTTYECNAGLSHTLIDDKLSLGAEVKVELTDDKTNRGAFESEVLVGPSMRFRPLPHAHIDVAPLIGVSHDAHRAEVFLLFGWEF